MIVWKWFKLRRFSPYFNPEVSLWAQYVNPTVKQSHYFSTMKFLSFILYAGLCLAGVIPRDDLNVTSLSSLQAAAHKPQPKGFCSPAVSDYENNDVKNELVRYANYCALAYCIAFDDLKDGNITDACSLAACYEQQGDKQIVYQFKRDISGFILQDNTNKELVMVFKGTSTVLEWLIDFNTVYHDYVPYTVSQGINKVPYTCKNCISHAGFHDSIQTFMNTAFPKMMELTKKYPDYAVKVTGHSLGAALAILGANEFKMMGLDTQVITFAGPKVANPNMAKWMDSIYNSDSALDALKGGASTLPSNSYIRVSNKGDIVPLVPLVAMGFLHAGVEIQLDENFDLILRGLYKTCYEIVDLGSVSDNAIDLLFQGKCVAAMEIMNVIDKHNGYFINVAECLKLPISGIARN